MHVMMIARLSTWFTERAREAQMCKTAQLHVLCTLVWSSDIYIYIWAGGGERIPHEKPLPIFFFFFFFYLLNPCQVEKVVWPNGVQLAVAHLYFADNRSIIILSSLHVLLLGHSI